METLLSVIDKYYLVFLVGAIICILALIGYFADKFTRKELTLEESGNLSTNIQNNNNVNQQ